MGNQQENIENNNTLNISNYAFCAQRNWLFTCIDKEILYSQLQCSERSDLHWNDCSLQSARGTTTFAESFKIKPTSSRVY